VADNYDIKTKYVYTEDGCYHSSAAHCIWSRIVKVSPEKSRKSTMKIQEILRWNLKIFKL
jgi:hypothetical protein